VEQWLVSVARVSLQEAQVIFLDEPTAALGAHEEAVLFSLIRSVVDRGISVVFISHRLAEVLELSDRVTALRGGRHVGTYKNDSLDHQTLVELVAGRAMSDAVISSTAGTTGKPALELQLLSAGPVRDVTFTLYQGEVLGVGGLVGSGRTELLEAIFGCRKIESGKIRVFGNSEKFRHPSDAVRSGVALLPEDRREQALFSQRSVRFNTVIAHVASFARGLLRLPNSRIEEEAARRQIEDLSIRAIGPQQLLAELSGGNQQKVVFGRWLCGDVMIFLADEPTKGVDVAGKLEILGELKRLASAGVGVIFVSSQLEEVADVADRVLIMREGRVVEILETPTSENEIMQACIEGEAA
jgi:ABC-type sugar transport system ATPase subunit